MRNSSVTFLHSAGPALLRRLWGPAKGAPRCPGAPELWVSFVGGSSLPSWALCLPNIVKTGHLSNHSGRMLEFFQQDCGIVRTKSKCLAAWLPFLSDLSCAASGKSQGSPRASQLSWARLSQQRVWWHQHLLASERLHVSLLCSRVFGFSKRGESLWDLVLFASS